MGGCSELMVVGSQFAFYFPEGDKRKVAGKFSVAAATISMWVLATNYRLLSHFPGREVVSAEP